MSRNDVKTRATRIGRWLMSAAVVTVLSWPAVAPAVDEPEVAVFLTEVVEDEEADQEISFWWSHAGTPEWTDSDRVVFEALDGAGVEPIMPEEVNISRIHRRPGISTDNAAQMGALVDADRVLVGEVQYRRIEPVAPLGYEGVEVRAEVDLVPVRDTGGVSLDRFDVTRHVFSADGDDLFEQARDRAGTALGEVMGQSLRRTIGEVGTEHDDPLLAFRNVERAENLDAIRTRLLELEEVDGVVKRWAAEGLIALKIKPHNKDQAAVFDYVDRLLQNQEFDGFRLVRSDDSVADGVTEFWLEPEVTESGAIR